MRGYDLWQEQRERAELVEGLRILCEDRIGKPTLKIWMPKAKNPYIHCYYNNAEARERRIQEEIARYKEHLKQKAAQSIAQKARKPLDVKKGDIFVTSWGYDQTNYDFIVVISVSQSGKTCKCQTASARMTGTSGQSDVLSPVREGSGAVFQMKITDHDLRGSYYYCKNSKRFDMFFKHETGREYYQTNSHFGH